MDWLFSVRWVWPEGFAKAIIPRANAPKQPIEGLEIIGVDRLSNAIDAIYN